MTVTNLLLIILVLSISASCAMFMNHQHDIIIEQRLQLRDKNCTEGSVLDILKDLR